MILKQTHALNILSLLKSIYQEYHEMGKFGKIFANGSRQLFSPQKNKYTEVMVTTTENGIVSVHIERTLSIKYTTCYAVYTIYSD